MARASRLANFGVTPSSSVICPFIRRMTVSRCAAGSGLTPRANRWSSMISSSAVNDSG